MDHQPVGRESVTKPRAGFVDQKPIDGRVLGDAKLNPAWVASRYKLDSYWVVWLANTLVDVIYSDDLTEAKRLSRFRLGELVDPVYGVREIDEAIRLRWQIASDTEE